jgi:hypothetical protein
MLRPIYVPDLAFNLKVAEFKMWMDAGGTQYHVRLEFTGKRDCHMLNANLGFFFMDLWPMDSQVEILLEEIFQEIAIDSKIRDYDRRYVPCSPWFTGLDSSEDP